jgi:hypothetical protein
MLNQGTQNPIKKFFHQIDIQAPEDNYIFNSDLFIRFDLYKDACKSSDFE